MHLRDGSPVTIEIFWQGPPISPWLPAALAVQLCIIALFVWVAVKLATQPLARLERAANSLGSDLRGEPLPEDGPQEVARAATALNAMPQARIVDPAAPWIMKMGRPPKTNSNLSGDVLPVDSELSFLPPLTSHKTGAPGRESVRRMRNICPVSAGSLKRCVLQEVLRSSRSMTVAASQSPS